MVMVIVIVIVMVMLTDLWRSATRNEKWIRVFMKQYNVQKGDMIDY